MAMEIEQEQVIAIIGARAGSKSVKDKNIAHLAGYPLLAYSIVAAKLSATISRVIMSTDSEQYADIARHYGAECLFLRPKEFSTDTATDRDYILHAIQWFEQHEVMTPEYWVLLRPTTPLRDATVMDNAVKKVVGRTDVTSLRSAHLCPESPFKWFKRDKNDFFYGLGQSENKSEERFNQPKESFENVYIPDGYVDVFRKSYLMNSNNLTGDKMLSFVSPVCTEVDSPEELDYLEYQINKSGCTLLDYLQKNHPTK